MNANKTIAGVCALICAAMSIVYNSGHNLEVFLAAIFIIVALPER